VRAWSERHLRDSTDSATIEIHRHACGERLRPVVVCQCCGEPVSATGIEYEVVRVADCIDDPDVEAPTRPNGHVMELPAATATVGRAAG
jgi:hypothetical protein